MDSWGRPKGISHFIWLKDGVIVVYYGGEIKVVVQNAK